MTTVVTAFYPIQSKFPPSQYLEWAERFLQLEAPIVLFTEEALAPQFRAMRPNKPLHIVTRPFAELDMWVLYEKQWRHQKTLDHEAYHTPELYALWAQKAVFVAETVRLNPFGTAHFYWCDIGAFRAPVLPEILARFPDFQHFQQSPSAILLNSVAPLDPAEHAGSSFQRLNRIVGGLWGGTAAACLRWRSAYEAQLIYFFAEGRFAGKDQSVMLSAYLEDPSLAVVVRPTTLLGDHWFFQQYLLSGLAPFAVDASYVRVGPPPRPVVSVNLMGGLGNQMFQVAAAHAYARKHGGRLALPAEKAQGDGRSTYWSSALSRFQHVLGAPFIKPSWWEPAATEWAEPAAPCSLGMRLQGYYQSPKYFAACARELRMLLGPTADVMRTVRKRYADVLEMADRVVVVHARRGDYLAAAEHHGPLTVAYYNAALEKMARDCKDPYFLLVADEPFWWMEVLSQLPVLQTAPFHILVEEDEVVTLGLLQQFQRFILANSTFSWWAAWLADAQRVIAPRQWFGPAGPKQWQDIYMRHWSLV